MFAECQAAVLVFGNLMDLKFVKEYASYKHKVLVHSMNQIITYYPNKV